MFHQICWAWANFRRIIKSDIRGQTDRRMDELIWGRLGNLRFLQVKHRLTSSSLLRKRKPDALWWASRYYYSRYNFTFYNIACWLPLIFYHYRTIQNEIKRVNYYESSSSIVTMENFFATATTPDLRLEPKKTWNPKNSRTLFFWDGTSFIGFNSRAR